MLCERNQKVLIEAVAAKQPLPPEVQSHVDACPACGAALAQEQLLFASIEAGIRKTANAEVPQSFVPTLRVRFAQELAAPPKRNSIAANWLWMAAAAALLLALLPLLRPRGSPTERAAQRAVQPPVREQGRVLQPSPSAAVAETGPVSHRLKRAFTPRLPVTASSQPEVIVRAEEREAYAKFVSAVAGRREILLALATPATRAEADKVSIEPLQVAALQVEPLEQQSSLTTTERDNP